MERVRMAWFKKEKTPKQQPADRRLKMPEGLWVKCEACKEIIYKKEVVLNANVCPKCNYHFRIDARQRIRMLLDEGAYEEFDEGILPRDALGFRDSKRYVDRLAAYQKKTGLKDAFISCAGTIEGQPVVLGVMEYGFMGGSMGSVVGEKIARAIERAIDQETPLIIVSCSGGARMQEGILSLMQMAKVCAALARFDQAGGLFISVLTNPTMGGVAASFASLGDVLFAEPRALIGFAGPRTIKATLRIELPKGFQTSEFLLEHGYIDRIVPRARLKSEIARTIDYCGK